MPMYIPHDIQYVMLACKLAWEVVQDIHPREFSIPLFGDICT